MAVAPTFVADMTTLKARLRLSGVSTGTDAQAAIDNATEEVALGFWRKLGSTRLSYLTGIAYDETPETDEKKLRVLANVTEVKWVRLKLSKVLPQLLMDGRGDLGEVWNNEAAFRQVRVTKDEEAQIQGEIDLALEILAGNAVAGSELTWGFYDGEPDSENEPQLPGDSLYGPDYSAVVTPDSEV